MKIRIMATLWDKGLCDDELAHTGECRQPKQNAKYMDIDFPDLDEGWSIKEVRIFGDANQPDEELEFDTVVPGLDDLIDVENFVRAVEDGAIKNGDGNGYFSDGEKYSSKSDVFKDEPIFGTKYVLWLENRV